MPRIIDVDAPTNRVFVSQFVIEQMRRIPPIDPESLRPHGRLEGKRKFCPNCGAKLDKEKSE